ncbi:hypothetical protein KEM56_000645 [Ascosphaera pollenicola]|nr:hypothetical protein KEM56_000645 [Ascosphaera pollenicola]
MAAPDHTRTSDVMANSQSIRDLTLPDMGPGTEAMASTKRMDMPGSRGLAPVPELTEDLDYQIDTSIMQTNLPQFSSAEYEDADDDMSVEIGRGDKPFARAEDSRDAMSYDDSQVLISPAAKLRSSAPLQSKTNRKSSWAKENLRKDASIRRANFATKDKDVASRSKTSRSPNKSQRRSLADVHEKVKDAFDNPYLSDERSQARGVASKTTRFNKTNLADLDNKVREAVANAARQHVNNEYAREHRAGLNNTNTITDNQTRLSFALPDTENLSDLVSANLDHGPRYSSKSRTTRFAPQTTMEPQQYASLGAVPVPEDEKIIFSSLRHLQEQVAALTADRDRLEQLERENADLRSGKRQGLQEDERRPTYVSSDDNDYGQRPAKAVIEKKRLEAANIALQEHLEQAAGKISSLETALKQAEKEKDAALSQRGAAYFASRELKIQNEELAKENEELQARIAMLTELLKLGRSGSKHDVQEKTAMPQAPGRNQDVSEEGSAVQDRKLSFDDGETTGGHVQQAKEMNARRARSRPTMPANGDSQDYAELFSLEIPFREQRSRAERSRPKSSEGLKPNKNTGNAKPSAKRKKGMGRIRSSRWVLLEYFGF